MSVYVALLRGINVGGKNSLPMKDLAAMFTKAGCTEVATYIQSGNVVFHADPKLAAKIPSVMQAAILKTKKIHVPVIVRSAALLKKIVSDNPYAKAGADSKLFHVGFLAEKPAQAALDSLDPKKSTPDEFTVLGTEVYFKLPNGVGKSKLTSQYFDSRLKTIITLRNWNTVLTLLEMCENS